MRKTALLATVVGLTLLGWPAGVHPATAQGQTPCKFAQDVTVSPGLSVQSGSQTFTTGGETGTVNCDGPVNGLPPTGAGTFGVAGEFSGSCQSAVTGDGAGSGVDHLTIPTSGGAQKITNNFTFTFGGKLPSHGGFVAGNFKGDHFSGTFEFTPMEGTCVTPVTKVHVTGEGVLH